MRATKTKRLAALFLLATILLGVFSAQIKSSETGTPMPVATISTVVGAKVTDAGTLHGWKQYFGVESPSTENAGHVWTDKSVFSSVADFKSMMTRGESINSNTAYDSMNIDEDHFLVALSALAGTKEIAGYSSVPTDTVFILDLSQSMDNSQYIPNMVKVANSAIQKLQDANLHNRVSLVMYSGNSVLGDSDLSHATVVLPLGRYVAGSNGAFISYSGSADDTTVYVADNVKAESGSAVSGSKETTGGTYIQGGLYHAYQEFKKAYEDGTTVIGSDLLQGGTKRIPVIMLMSDGLPTAATDEYSTFTRTEDGKTGVTNKGNGGENTDTITFLTQLTAKWLRDSVTDWYDNEALFYTLWLKAKTDTVNGTLNPSSSNDTLDSWWKTYLNAADGTTVKFRSGSSEFSITRDSIVEQVPSESPETAQYTQDWQAAQNYVNRAFTASNATDFENSFTEIVNTIEAQSRYYPTMVQGSDHSASGYITIEDPIGPFMEVKEMEGILIGGHLFTGNDLIQTMIGTNFGSSNNLPEDVSLLIDALQRRIGVSEADATDLVQKAWQHGQLGYDTATENYSNYIGWYADQNNNYLGFWHNGQTDADIPGNATQIIKSYCYCGQIDASISDSNIKGTNVIHIDVRESTQISNGSQVVTLRIPAMMIPLFVYRVNVNSTSLEASTGASLVTEGSANPLRLLMEVGLHDGINELNVSSIVDQTGYAHTDSGGNYMFYTNCWGLDDRNSRFLKYPDPSAETAAISHFTPSELNEKYYYFQDTAICTDTSGTKYTGTSAPQGDGYYYVDYLFVGTGNGTDANIVKRYTAISTEAIAHAEPDAVGQGWHIPGGTPKYSISGYTVSKSSNSTDTLSYLTKAGIPVYSSGRYDVYKLHGNNGRLILGQATGMALTKSISTAFPGASTEDFVLNIDFTAPAGQTLPDTVMVSYDGQTCISMNIDEVSVILDADQTVWIFGLPGGTGYTVTEDSHAIYQPENVTVSGTLTEQTITPVTFTNRAKDPGRVVISKVVDPFGTETAPSTLAFDFVATVTDKNGDPLANTAIVTSGGTLTTSQAGQIRFALKNGESLSINELPDGSTVVVREENIPAGFTVDKDSASATTELGKDKQLVFTNTYAPSSVYGTNVKITGTKLLEGRQWQDFDTYRFSLQYDNGVSWQTLAGGTDDTATKLDPTFTLSDVIGAFPFDHEGIYSFRIVEEEGSLGGVSYDPSVWEFSVTVEDDWTGEYKIQSVTSESAGVQISSTANNGTTEYTVAVTFTNQYSTGTAFVDLSGSKELLGDSLSEYTGEEGFAFTLYSATKDADGKLRKDTLIHIAHLNDEGKFIFDHDEIDKLVFDQTGTYYFIAEEAVVGSDPLLVFDDTCYEVVVVVTDNMTGKLLAETTVTRVKDGQRSTVDVNGLKFINKRNPAPISAIISGRKQYNLTLPSGMFAFDLYKASLVGNAYTPDGDALLSAENTSDGFTLADTSSTEVLKFSVPGDYHFVVREHLPDGVDASNPTLNGITYDTVIYGITIRVTESTDRNGRFVLSYQALVNSQENGSIIFENTYNITAPVDVTISGSKTLNGSAEGTDGFTIDLFDATISHNAVILGSKIDSVSVADGSFFFDALRYDTLSDVGIHYYVIKESIPEQVDSTGTWKGITYDNREYLVAVTVSDNGDGTLSAASSISLGGDAVDSIDFANKYAITVPTSISLSGEKTLDGAAPKDGDFSFALYNATPSETGLVLSGDPIDIQTTENGIFRFDDIHFTELDDAGFYFYAIKEVIPAGADEACTVDGIRYDPTVYYVLVSVQDNGDGTLSIFSENITADGVRDKIIFANRTVAISDTPETGDSATPVLWCFLLLASGIGMITLTIYARKKRS